MPPTPDDVRRIIADALSPAHFFVRPPLRLESEHVAAEEVSWEVFRGRLLDPAHTRQRRTFEAWNVYLWGDEGRSTEPLLSVKLDLDAGELHVVRAALSYVHEAYDAGGNVILTREVQKWVRELVGTIAPSAFTSADDLLSEITCRLFQAVVGTSRLPLTSIEVPLPAFTFGQLAYFYRPDSGTEPMRSFRELLERAGPRNGRELWKLLEMLLRAVPTDELSVLADHFVGLSQENEAVPRTLLLLLRDLFNDVSLSPFTDLTEKALTFARQLTIPFGKEAELADFLLCYLLRQTGRHLTAYDLVRFHHAGANYPDALLLDAVLQEYLDLIHRRPELFLDAENDHEAIQKSKRLRRRGLRQAWLIRQRYRGHAVPDAPTSPGENVRVLPAPYVRIPEEQIAQPQLRTKHLFTEEVLLGETAGAVLRQSILDLQHPMELRELGTALYLDRPLGAFKAPGEPDQTIMLSYVAFSRNIATQRLLLLGEEKELLPADELAAFRQALQALPVSGVPVAEVPAPQRPGVVSLADAARTADDFVLMRTTTLPVCAFFTSFKFEPLLERIGSSEWWGRPWLILGRPEKESGEVIITVYEAGTLRKRLELSADPRQGYICRAGLEHPRKGLRVRRIWEETGGELQERDLTGEELFVRPG